METKMKNEERNWGITEKTRKNKKKDDKLK